VAEFNLGCQNNDHDHIYKVYVTTFLGFGANEAQERYEEGLIQQAMASQQKEGLIQQAMASQQKEGLIQQAMASQQKEGLIQQAMASQQKTSELVNITNRYIPTMVFKMNSCSNLMVFLKTSHAILYNYCTSYCTKRSDVIVLLYLKFPVFFVPG
jgi:Golgi nucleoside diphosphatase